MTASVNIAARTKQMLHSLGQDSLAPYLADWPGAARPRALAASDLPVLRWLPAICGDAAAFAADLVAALCREAPSLAWRQTYSSKELGAAFLDNYGWSEIVGSNGALASERLACGFLILGPSTLYPRHRHEAAEIYLPLSGTAAWQQGDGVWRERAPGTLIHHAGGEPHAMRTGRSPLLALYLWRGPGLTQKARLDELPASA